MISLGYCIRCLSHCP